MSVSTHRSLIATAALATLSFAAQATPPPVSFAAPLNYATGALAPPGWSETTLVTADFNNDGRADVASTDLFAFPQAAPIVQLGLSSGGFQSPGTRLPSSANGAGALAADDFNFDGKVDLIVSTTTALKVYLGNGNGTFTAGASYSVYTGGQEDIVTLDLNNDGKKDAVAITRTGIQVLKGNGNGTFTQLAGQTVPGIFPSGIDKAKFNYDSNPDLLLIDGAGQVIPLLGTGTGSFTQVQGAQGIAGFILGTGLAADFNHDGIDDAVAMPEFNAGVRNAVVFISNGSGGFVSQTGSYYDGGLAPVSGEIADLNLDGHPDIIASDTLGGQLVMLLGNGDGTFVQGGGFAASFSCQTPVVLDVNLDGKKDLATVGIASGGVLSVLHNTTP
ncbi:MAG TPA: VCBS repeat-containing protein [Solimonas sp.]|nr:VCBS repeat-containing protein [Solimonas sp.]